MRWRPIAPLVLALALAGCGGPKPVKVPDVAGYRGYDAQRALQQVGIDSRLVPPPPDPSKCLVTSQSARGFVPPETEIMLQVRCPFRDGED